MAGVIGVRFAALQTIMDYVFHGDITNDIAQLLGTILALLLRLFPLLVPSVSSTTCTVSSNLY
jgi:hypothetical protein